MRVDEEKASRHQGQQSRAATATAAAALSRTVSRASTSRHGLARIRSQNGYSVDDDDDDDVDVDEETQVEDQTGQDTQTTRPGKDPFEVGWEGGADPLCPRSFSRKRKWVITVIVSHVSLCV
ncbi:hypothetical protein E4U54_006428, partial [Claviceps lovelessii]